MKKLLKPASFGFYFLMLFVFFFIGIYVAGFVGAGKNQMLAGGAIVLGWGVMFAGIAFVASFIIARYAPHRNIVRLNWLLLIVLGSLYGITHYRYVQKQKLKQEDPVEKKFKSKPTTPTTDTVKEPTAMLNNRPAIQNLDSAAEIIQESSMGMGYFTPNYYENSTLYFYGNPNLEKSVVEHVPTDSITFRRNKYNQFEIATAPPWLVPDVLKLDYDMLYFKIKSITREFAEVTVNETNGQTSFVNRRAGNLVYWGDFFLQIHSVKFFPDSTEKVRARPFPTTGTDNTRYEFMRPVRVQNDWMQVLLLDGDFKTVGGGWIQWNRDGKLLILYNLLS